MLDKGSLDVSAISARWFRYTKQQNGMTRDMIIYTIPLNGFAYMITCGTNLRVYMGKYRASFDEIARSLGKEDDRRFKQKGDLSVPNP